MILIDKIDLKIKLIFCILLKEKFYCKFLCMMVVFWRKSIKICFCILNKKRFRVIVKKYVKG